MRRSPDPFRSLDAGKRAGPSFDADFRYPFPTVQRWWEPFAQVQRNLPLRPTGGTISRMAIKLWSDPGDGVNRT